MPAELEEHTQLLAELAVAGGLVTQEQADEAMAVLGKVRELGVPEELGHILVKKGYLSEAQLRELEGRLGSRQPARVGGFEIVSRLGRGGMGAVYKARQISMDRIVALKILPPVLSKDKEYTERFFREARALAKMNHPNVVQGIDVGFADKYHYFAMEYVDGETLQDIVSRDGPMQERKALEIVHQVAQALHHAFRNDMIHRDVKPDNIMVTAGGVAKLCDLGLAKNRAGDSSVTQTGLTVGTPHYISPEQASGEPDVDIRADIYSLGATLYHMVCGTPPYEGSSAAVVMTKHLNDAVPNPRDARPELSVGIARLIEKMMAKERRDRYQTPEELIGDIDLVLAGKSPAAAAPAVGRSAVRAPVSERISARYRTAQRTAVQRPVADRRLLMAVWAGLLLLAVAGLVFTVLVLYWGGIGGTSGDAPPVIGTDVGKREPPDNHRDDPEDGGTQSPEAIRLASMERQLTQIEDFWRANPTAHKEVWDRMRMLRDGASGTDLALKVGSRMREVENARIAYNQGELDKALARSRELEAQGKFGEALKAFGNLPLSPELLQAATREQQAIRKRAMGRLDAMAKAAWKRLEPEQYGKDRQGDLDAALLELEPAAALGIADVAEAATAEAAKLRAEHAARLADLERRLSEERDRELAERRREFDASRDAILANAAAPGRRDMKTVLSEALAAASDARSGLLAEKFKPFEKEAVRLVRDLRSAVAFYDGLGRSVAAQKGRTVRLRIDGVAEDKTIMSADASYVHLKPRGFSGDMAVGARYETIDSRDLVSLAGGDSAAPEGAYMAGILVFFSGRRVQAIEPLEIAEASEQYREDAGYYLAAAREARRQLREGEAQRELAQIWEQYAKLNALGDKAGPEQWEAFGTRLKKLVEDYGDTNAVKRNLGE